MAERVVLSNKRVVIMYSLLKAVGTKECVGVCLSTTLRPTKQRSILNSFSVIVLISLTGLRGSGIRGLVFSPLL